MSERIPHRRFKQTGMTDEKLVVKPKRLPPKPFGDRWAENEIEIQKMRDFLDSFKKK